MDTAPGLVRVPKEKPGKCQFICDALITEPGSGPRIAPPLLTGLREATPLKGYMSITPHCGKLRQEDCLLEFRNLERSCLQIKRGARDIAQHKGPGFSPEDQKTMGTSCPLVLTALPGPAAALPL